MDMKKVYPVSDKTRRYMQQMKRRRSNTKYLVEFWSDDLQCKMLAFGDDCLRLRDGESFIRLRFKKEFKGAFYYDDFQHRYVVAKCIERKQKHNPFKFGWEYEEDKKYSY